jgi:hypothetical protein
MIQSPLPASWGCCIVCGFGCGGSLPPHIFIQFDFSFFGGLVSTSLWHFGQTAKYLVTPVKAQEYEQDSQSSRFPALLISSILMNI